MAIPERRVVDQATKTTVSSLEDFVSVKESSDFVNKFDLTKSESAKALQKTYDDVFDAVNNLGSDKAQEKIESATKSSGALDGMSSADKQKAVEKVTKDINSKMGVSGTTLAAKNKLNSILDECDISFITDLGIDVSILAALLGLEVCNQQPFSSAAQKFSGKLGAGAVEHSVADILNNSDGKHADAVLKDMVGNQNELNVKKSTPDATRRVGDLINRSDMDKAKSSDDAYATSVNAMSVASENWLGDIDGADLSNTCQNETLTNIGRRKAEGVVPLPGSTYVNEPIQTAPQITTIDYLSAGNV